MDGFQDDPGDARLFRLGQLHRLPLVRGEGVHDQEGSLGHWSRLWGRLGPLGERQERARGLGVVVERGEPVLFLALGDGWVGVGEGWGVGGWGVGAEALDPGRVDRGQAPLLPDVGHVLKYVHHTSAGWVSTFFTKFGHSFRNSISPAFNWFLPRFDQILLSKAPIGS